MLAVLGLAVFTAAQHATARAASADPDNKYKSRASVDAKTVAAYALFQRSSFHSFVGQQSLICSVFGLVDSNSYSIPIFIDVNKTFTLSSCSALHLTVF